MIVLHSLSLTFKRSKNGNLMEPSTELMPVNGMMFTLLALIQMGICLIMYHEKIPPICLNTGLSGVWWSVLSAIPMDKLNNAGFSP